MGIEISHQSQLDWLSIRLAPQMTRARFYMLMQHFVSPEMVFGATAREIASLRGFDSQTAAGVLKNFSSSTAQEHLDKMMFAGVRLVTRDSPEYPFGLAHSHLVPPMFFIKGELAAEDKYSIAMVGSRHATTYGRAVARELAGGLARYGLTVISGFARGIDGEAHHAAIKAGGRTIAVLGNGLDICYPSEHRSLVEMVANNGALISEYPLGTSPDRYNFPERNHVIATLALGTIVVEAAEKSGSLITARLALEENRFVFAVPGDITRNNSRGANGLIQQGARMVQRPQDVLIEMKDMLRGYLEIDQEGEPETSTADAPDEVASVENLPSPQPGSPEPASSKISQANTEAAPSPAARQDAARDWVDDLAGLDDDQIEVIAAQLQLDVRATKNRLTMKQPPVNNDRDDLAQTKIEPPQLPKKPVPAKPVSAQPAKPKLSPDEKYIVDLLHHEAMVFDELADRAFGRGIDVPRLTALLMKLELKRIIRQLPGRYYVLFG